MMQVAHTHCQHRSQHHSPSTRIYDTHQAATDELFVRQQQPWLFLYFFSNIRLLEHVFMWHFYRRILYVRKWHSGTSIEEILYVQKCHFIIAKSYFHGSKLVSLVYSNPFSINTFLKLEIVLLNAG